ncbi:Tubulin gamma chain [Caligus rogercresseyi]|uniref:Tubulin gamma chain n=1 Tax=Caligus rogercresseyi TaxID=217165 RepID=A0A7T8HL33_CALRO|nr:Tubulin gamma chain [Caligus rogercresseyi]
MTGYTPIHGGGNGGRTEDHGPGRHETTPTTQEHDGSPHTPINKSHTATFHS